MSSLPTPNFMTREEHKIYGNMLSEKILPKGSFVRPIEPKYLPSHITETGTFKWFNPDKEVFVYCAFGIICIPSELLIQV